jgi:hypothetical protein
MPRILIDKDLQQVKHVFIPIFSPEDSFVIDYIQKLVYKIIQKIVILDVNRHVDTNFVMKKPSILWNKNT